MDGKRYHGKIISMQVEGGTANDHQEGCRKNARWC